MIDPNVVALRALRLFRRVPPFFVRATSEANLDLLERYRLSPLFRWALRGSAGVIVLNRHMAERVARLQAPPKRIHAIPNGVDCTRFHPNMEEPKNSRQLRIGYVGRLVEAKGAALLLRVVERTANQFRWRIVGAGPMARAFQRLVEKHEGIEWREKIPHEEMPEFYRNLDVFVLPSLDEGMSNALLEAMASRLPCIISDIPANRPFMDCARFFRAGDAEELIAGIRELAAHREVRRALGEKARRRVEADYSLAKSVAIYKNLLCRQVPSEKGG